MRSLTIKTICEPDGARTSPTHSDAPLGDFQDGALQVRRIVGIPAHTTAAEVLKLFMGTCIFDLQDTPKLEIKFSELGIGRLIKR